MEGANFEAVLTELVHLDGVGVRRIERDLDFEVSALALDTDTESKAVRAGEKLTGAGSHSGAGSDLAKDGFGGSHGLPLSGSCPRLGDDLN